MTKLIYSLIQIGLNSSATGDLTLSSSGTYKLQKEMERKMFRLWVSWGSMEDTEITLDISSRERT